MIESGMKIDGRTLDHATLEQIRLMAMKRVREGEEPAAVIASFGFCRTTIYKWMNLTAGRGRGLKALSWESRRLVHAGNSGFVPMPGA
jgi:hypothetical protein